MFTTWSEIKYIAASATRLGDFEIYWLKFSYKSSPNMLLLLFKKIGWSRPLFVYFRTFQIQFYRKILDFSGIRTQIISRRQARWPLDHHHGPICNYFMGSLVKHPSFIINCCGYFLGNFVENWATFYSYIWSHCLKHSRRR